MKKRWLKSLAPALVLMSGVVVLQRDSLALPDYTKKTRKECIYCHERSPSSGKYTEAGEYYKDHGTFKGFVPKKP